MAADMSRVLVIGSTGYFGKFMVDASVRLGHPTFALLRESTQASDPQKAKLIESFKSRGVNLIYGDIYEKEKLVATLKQVDVVICSLSHRSPHLYEDEVMLILAIKEAGNIKRYIPSEFGFDVEHLDIMEPAKSVLGVKARVRQRLREEGVPHTIVCGALAANWYFLPRIGQAGASGPPTDKVLILGDGNTKVALVGEEDTATYTIKAADDPRTLNKIMYLRPPSCVITHNEMIDLWEKKTGKKFERIYIPEQEVITNIEDGPVDARGSYMIAHAGFVKGQTTIDIDTSIGVEASELYPETSEPQMQLVSPQLLHQRLCTMNIKRRLKITCLATNSIISFEERLLPDFRTTNATGISPASSSKALHNELIIEDFIVRDQQGFKVCRRYPHE